MIKKTLRHKVNKDIFGYIFGDSIEKSEIGHVTSPQILGEDTTLELLTKMYTSNAYLLRQLTNYELIEIEIIIP